MASVTRRTEGEPERVPGPTHISPPSLRWLSASYPVPRRQTLPLCQTLLLCLLSWKAPPLTHLDDMLQTSQQTRRLRLWGPFLKPQAQCPCGAPSEDMPPVPEFPVSEPTTPRMRPVDSPARFSLHAARPVPAHSSALHVFADLN